MTISNTQPEGSNDNTENTTSRRSYLAAVATAPFITATNATAATSLRVRPKELLITQTQLPDSFTVRDGIDADSIFDAVQPPDSSSTPCDQIKFNNFWVRKNTNEPLWVAGSSACVSVAPEDVTKAAETMTQEYDEFIDTYDAETDLGWHFDMQYEETEMFREWRTEIYIGHHVTGEELFEMTDDPTLIDAFRIQYINNTLLGTSLFGPMDWYWSYTELFDQLTEYQREQALSISETRTIDNI